MLIMYKQFNAHYYLLSIILFIYNHINLYFISVYLTVKSMFISILSSRKYIFALKFTTWNGQIQIQRPSRWSVSKSSREQLYQKILGIVQLSQRDEIDYWIRSTKMNPIYRINKQLSLY